MDVIRRNSDYALCLMVHLAEHYDDAAVSTKKMSKREKIPYPLACKMMQKLQQHKLVKSIMGPKGGFRLNKEPSKINLLEIIEIIQGPVIVNRCLVKDFSCPRKSRCPINGKLKELQSDMRTYLKNISLNELLNVETCRETGK
jgi:Rrf2 family protein